MSIFKLISKKIFSTFLLNLEFRHEFGSLHNIYSKLLCVTFEAIKFLRNNVKRREAEELQAVQLLSLLALPRFSPTKGPIVSLY